MPIVAFTILLGALLGYTLRARLAYAATAAVGAIAIAANSWAVLDDKGDDPSWLIAVAVAGAILALAATKSTSALRSTRTAAKAEAG